MDDEARKAIAGLLEKSEFLAAQRRLKGAPGPSRLFGRSVRPLSKAEIAALEAQGNHSPDWPAVKAADGFRTECIRGSTFSGPCVLGVFTGAPREIAPGAVFPSGIYGSTLSGAEVGNDCLVKDCGLVANYVIEEGAVVCGIGALTAAAGCAFGNGLAVPVGNETGGREVAILAELDIALASRIALERRDRELLAAYADLAARYREQAAADFGVVGKGSVVCRVPTVRNAWIGPGALVDGATLIDNCTILSGPGERTEVSHGAIVRNSCLQWGCEVTTQAIVVDSLLTEHSHAGRHGKVTASLIGPNTGIAEGEVTSCLVGPFVGFHHQSLLIAALWPEGKGNVAYGANVGSNHTSRAPDQEIFCGEGVFFGLGTNVKFPADFSGAPYSIIATGVTTLPQKLRFPFSLVSSPAHSFPGVSPAFNEIIPGWVLSDNIYMVRRNEGKYKKRNKAKRTAFDFTVFRPEVVDLMVAARDRLAAVGAATGRGPKAVYTDKDIAGLGKNYLTEENRSRGIAAYDFYIEFYCLSGLYGRLDAEQGLGSAVYAQKTDDPGWEHRRLLLVNEGFHRRSRAENLVRLIALLEKIAEDTCRAKARDDERGGRIIPEYDCSAVMAEADPFIKSTREETALAVKRVRELALVLRD